MEYEVYFFLKRLSDNKDFVYNIVEQAMWIVPLLFGGGSLLLLGRSMASGGESIGGFSSELLQSSFLIGVSSLSGGITGAIQGFRTASSFGLSRAEGAFEGFVRGAGRGLVVGMNVSRLPVFFYTRHSDHGPKDDGDPGGTAVKRNSK